MDGHMPRFVAHTAPLFLNFGRAMPDTVDSSIFNIEGCGSGLRGAALIPLISIDLNTHA